MKLLSSTQFLVVLFIMLYKVVLACECVGGILVRERSKLL